MTANTRAGWWLMSRAGRIRKMGEACLAALGRISPRVGFRIGSGMTERAAYRDLQLLGLTQLDLQHIPSLPRAHTVARKEILRLHGELQLDAPGQVRVRKAGLVPA
ncbi:division plane positioning ATPase MipZ [Novosphingobium aquae]|uniref:Division plane positioning ATPase MipZ n=1 Tax=Novosphingobium aquae TaxID=3133435 RepID=A0ABU8S7Q0_9SPHN